MRNDRTGPHNPGLPALCGLRVLAGPAGQDKEREVTKLTDEELADLDQWAACDLAKTEGDQVAALVDEVRQLRALLATPMTYDHLDVHPCDDATDPDVWILDAHYTPDEALAIGAACIRAALSAKGGDE